MEDLFAVRLRSCTFSSCFVPLRSSYCGTLLDRFTEGVARQGHTHEIADLHAERVDPVFTAADFGQCHDRPLEGRLLPEQARVDRCYAVAVISPIWRLSLPAMLGLV